MGWVMMHNFTFSLVSTPDEQLLRVVLIMNDIEKGGEEGETSRFTGKEKPFVISSSYIHRSTSSLLRVCDARGDFLSFYIFQTAVFLLCFSKQSIHKNNNDTNNIHPIPGEEKKTQLLQIRTLC